MEDEVSYLTFSFPDKEMKVQSMRVFLFYF